MFCTLEDFSVAVNAEKCYRLIEYDCKTFEFQII